VTDLDRQPGLPGVAYSAIASRMWGERATKRPGGGRHCQPWDGDGTHLMARSLRGGQVVSTYKPTPGRSPPRRPRQRRSSAHATGGDQRHRFGVGFPPRYSGGQDRNGPGALQRGRTPTNWMIGLAPASNRRSLWRSSCRTIGLGHRCRGCRPDHKPCSRRRQHCRPARDDAASVDAVLAKSALSGRPDGPGPRGRGVGSDSHGPVRPLASSRTLRADPPHRARWDGAGLPRTGPPARPPVASRSSSRSSPSTAPSSSASAVRPRRPPTSRTPTSSGLRLGRGHRHLLHRDGVH